VAEFLIKELNEELVEVNRQLMLHRPGL
jgi:hypothetical protein